MLRVLIAVLLGGFLLSGCGSLQTMLTGNGAAVPACVSYERALNVAATALERDTLNTFQVDAIDRVIEVVDPICTADTPPTDQEAIDKVRNGVAEIIRVTED